MTTAPPARAHGEEIAGEAGSLADGDEGDLPRARRVTWRSVVFTLLLIPSVVAVPVLGYAGATILRDEDTGQVVNRESDAAAPGFEALVTPTPTQMVAMLDGAGAVAGVQVLALTDPMGGGTVVSAPVATHVPVAFVDTDTKSLEELYGLSGLNGLEQAVETMFTAGMAEALEIPPDQWAALIAPLGSLTVENPTAFTGVRPDGTPGATFEEGTITLTPDQVADFILLKADGEVDTARNDRQIALWQAWIEAVAEQGDDSVPGEVDQGLGRFVRGLAGGVSSVVPLPVDQIPIPGVSLVDSNIFLPAEDQVDALSLRAIPFPVGVGRLRTRLIDGVGDVDGLKAEAAAVLVENGAEITVIGNAQEFGVAETTVVYFRTADEPAAQVMADAVGGRLERGDSTNESVDVVVVIGRDFVDADADASGPTLSVDDGGGLVPPTSVPFGGDGVNPGITPGAPGGEEFG